MKKIFCLLLAGFGYCCATAQTPVINTVVNVMDTGKAGDGLPAVDTWLRQPKGITYDKYGNLYVVDRLNHVVRKVDRAGISTIVAGQTGISGTAGTGDGGSARAALLNCPTGIAVDGLGNLYIADAPGLIRKVDPAGIITTIAGLGTLQPVRVNSVPAKDLLIGLAGITADAAGNVYFTDGGFGNPCVGKIDPAGMYTRLTAGYGTYSTGYGHGDGGPSIYATIGEPRSIAIDGAGNIFIADNYYMCIRKINSRGIISTYAGARRTPSGPPVRYGDGGPAIAAYLMGTGDIAVDNAGNLYIYNATIYRIRKVERSTGIINTIAGIGIGGSSGDGGDPLLAQLVSSFEGLAYDSSTGNLAMKSDYSVRMISGLPKYENMDPNVVDTVAAPLSIQTPAAWKATVFPNPVRNSLQLQNIHAACTATITDIQGKVCLQAEVPAGNASIDTHVLVPGTYQMVLTEKESGMQQQLSLVKVQE
jgi:hypothetical protein